MLEGRNTMNERNSSHVAGYIFAGMLGAVGGAFLVAIANKALPKMMAEFMRNMMSGPDNARLAPSEF
jgi:hypothetical protein